MGQSGVLLSNGGGGKTKALLTPPPGCTKIHAFGSAHESDHNGIFGTFVEVVEHYLIDYVIIRGLSRSVMYVGSVTIC